MDPILDPEDREFEEALLRTGRDVKMSPELRDKTLAALGVATATMTVASAAKAGWLGWLSTKGGALSAAGLVGAIGVAGAVAVSGGFSKAPTPKAAVKSEVPVSLREPKVTEDTVEPHSTAPPSPEVAAPEPSLEPDTPEVVHQAHSASKRRASAAPSSSSEEPSALRRELSHIGRVEAALRAGKAGEALSLLAEYRRRFSRPRLALEAEVLTIQALHESGSVAAARKRAKRFLEKHPTSPLRVRAEQYLK